MFLVFQNLSVGWCIHISCMLIYMSPFGRWGPFFRVQRNICEDSHRVILITWMSCKQYFLEKCLALKCQVTLMFRYCWKLHLKLSLHSILQDFFEVCMKTFSGLWASKPSGLLHRCFLGCKGAIHSKEQKMLFWCRCIDVGCFSMEINQFLLRSKTIQSWKYKQVSGGCS